MHNRLPESFKQRMKEMLKDEYEAFLESYDKKDKSGIRINTLKIGPEEFKELSDFKLSKIPWIEGGFFYDENDIPSKHPYYYAGLYYIQEPSAMTPAALFDVNPGDKVLDLCAAPGGKSTALAAKLQGKGVLVSNDVSNSRAKALLKNIELFGVRNAIVVSESTAKLAKTFYGYFDRILVDAPCSGEGMFRKQPAIIKNWEQYGTKYYSDIQKSILPDAIKMLKPGGKLLFSTCTFSPEEDEETVGYILENYSEMKLCNAYNDDKKNLYKEIGFDTGHAEWMEKPIEDVDKCVRLWPHRLDGEGHFLAVFEKDPDAICECAIPAKNKKIEIPDELDEFLKELNFEIRTENICEKDGRYYLLPEDIPSLSGLRILRSGLLLGEMKKNRFEPSQALASSLRAGEYFNCIDFSQDDPNVIKYLKCETIETDKDVKDGFALVTCNGFALGFAKVKNGNLKNKYLPGWRLM